MEEATLQSAQPAEETLLAEWQEAEHPLPGVSGKNLSLLVFGGAILTVAAIGVAIWQQDYNLYFIAAVLILGIVTLLVQNRRTTPSLTITITNIRLLVGNRQYLMEELAGFWLQHDRETVVINVEPKKAAMVPVTFLYSVNNTDEARRTLQQIMPELESRLPNSSDKINRYFRF